MLNRNCILPTFKNYAGNKTLILRYATKILAALIWGQGQLSLIFSEFISRERKISKVIPFKFFKPNFFDIMDL